jgi:hypothetical protein
VIRGAETTLGSLGANGFWIEDPHVSLALLRLFQMLTPFFVPRCWLKVDTNDIGARL